MVKFWIQGEYYPRVCSNLHELDLSKVTPREIVEISIQHWEFIGEITEENPALLDNLCCGGRDTCALCQQYGARDCTGCPVATKAHRCHCLNTPYVDYLDSGLSPEMIEAEIDFLYEVLEEVKR